MFFLPHTFWKPTSRYLSGRKLIFAINCAVLCQGQPEFLLGGLKLCTFVTIKKNYVSMVILSTIKNYWKSELFNSQKRLLRRSWVKSLRFVEQCACDEHVYKINIFSYLIKYKYIYINRQSVLETCIKVHTKSLHPSVHCTIPYTVGYLTACHPPFIIWQIVEWNEARYVGH